ncbi:MAG TPA: SDR family oxidoreductase [Bacteroidales bacterium]|nr:SDR family oxidoreductase [Bacteroidales bacterium]
MSTKSFILLTGSTSGIGENIAITLSVNHNLILGGRDEEKLEKVKQKCSRPDLHLTWCFDLNNVGSLQDSLTSFIDESNAQIESFIHCAGFLKLAPLKSISLDSITQTLNINLISATLILKVLINKRHNQENLKRVIFISSNVSVRGAKAFSVYSASKGALNSLAKSLAVELAPRIRVNSILPGGVRTQMTENMFRDSALIEEMTKKYPLGMGKPEDISNLVLFLLSEESGWITGQDFIIDGGRSIDITG